MIRRAHSEAGFALLLIYAMAAIVAIMLLVAMPRAAFEAQRDKEQLLIDRGEAYSRGIQLYVRKFNRYPADFKALESTGNQRFIRHLYTDPMRGKPGDENSEWRIIHVGPGGIFTDSLLYTKKKDPKAEQQTFITELAPVGGGVAPDPGQLNLANRRRPSDGGNPNSMVPEPIQVDPNAPPAPPAFQPPPGLQFPPGVQVPGTNPQASNNGVPSPAVNLINNILTTPRPGGMPPMPGFPGQPGQPPSVDQFGTPAPQQAGQQPGIGQAIPQQANAAQQIGGGIAGVASKLEREGIKSYRDRQSYHEWEFVYDLTQDKARAGGAGQQQPPIPGQAPPGQAPPGQIPPGQIPPFPVRPVK